MIRYIILPHARARMAERAISRALLETALRDPTKIEYDAKGRMLIKKFYKKRGRQRLLLVAAERQSKHLAIITVIDTSKVRKYL